jgi:hypothetical protein
LKTDFEEPQKKTITEEQEETQEENEEKQKQHRSKINNHDIKNQKKQ